MLNIQRTAAHLSGAEVAFFKRRGLTPAAYNLLRILRGRRARGQKQGVRASKIGCEMVVRMPDVTRLIDRLERDGLVTRSTDEADRRVKFVRITDEGLALLARLDPEVVNLGCEQLGHMSKAQLGELSRLLELARNEGGSDEA